ncbi:FAD:protein FMN transferase [Leifsonia sp. fls2-241-R2A-40a]|uniref:FAD:protein FMN transferase n=1 Tax=Leifsonia sp. fls2-241-R2A-40a TaxID=3040290 RepID=UPI00255115E3|nr:FAD:protein FMN transferase [Leifsonia sp. fls2-241-R2A-40a]
MRFVETVMGIPMSIDIRDEQDAAPAAERAFQVLKAADRRFSSYRPDSELSRANAAGGTAAEYSADFREVVAIGEAAGRDSGGAFRIRLDDGTWDLDGVVKGWAAARAARELAASGVRNFCLNAGGDVVAAGSPGGERPWNVGIRSPHAPSDMMAVLAVSDVGVATSGLYERGAHIVDGRDGSTPRSLLSVTVVADDLTTADVLATAVFGLGREGIDWALTAGARGVLAMDASNRLLRAGDLAFARPEHAA